MLKLFILTFSCLVFLPIASASEQQRILIVGDSLTAGYGVSKGDAFPAQLEQLIQKKHPEKKYQVINAGSSGSTSASAVSRLRWHLKKKPKILVLALGANDGLRGTPLESTKANLATAIDLAQQNQIKVFLAGMKLPMNYGKKYRQDFENVFKDLVREKKAASIPFLLKGVGADPNLNLSDGIHPNEKGHKIVADTVYQAIKGDL